MQQYIWGSLTMEQGREVAFLVCYIEECRVIQVTKCIQILMQKQQKKVYLDLCHAFGSNFMLETKNEIGIIEEDSKMKMVYTVGKSIVKQLFEDHSMEFIKLSDNVESIECIAISPSRNHIAVCEKIKNQNFLLLNLYGLKTRDSEIKHFKLPQTEKQSTFKIIAFSPSQPKYACCMTSEPDNQLMFLDISRSRGLAVSNFSVEGTASIAICPTQSHLISCAGRNIFKLFKVEDYSFKAYEEVKKLPKARNFTAHAWFDKTKILVGTDRGELFMIGPVGNNFQVKRHLGNVFSLDNVDTAEIGLTAICVFSKGFMVGSSQGNFALWMKREENEQNFQDEYTGDLAKKWFVGDSRAARVISIAMCPREQLVAMSFSNNSIATTSLTDILESQEIEHSQSSPSSGQGKTCSDMLCFLEEGFHQAQISCLDVCLHRPIFATLSKKESTIRLWNYKHPRCELTKLFDSKTDAIEAVPGSQLILSLGLHPLGYYMAVGCCDKMRIYHILDNELRNFREIVLRGVCCVRFSNGGQYLAVAYPRNKSTAQKSSVHLINIYNSYTLQEIGRLSDHSNTISELVWKPDDRALYSVGVDGTMAEWIQGDPNSQNKDWNGRKWAQTNSRYHCSVFDKTGKSLLAAGAENGKSIVRQVRVEKEGMQKVFAVGGFRLNRLCWLTSQWKVPAILGGTEEGAIKVFNSVFDNIVEQTLNVHRKQITGLVTSPCGRYVISTAKDGIIFIYQVSLTNRQGFVNRKLHDQLNDYEINPLIAVLDDNLADIVLVHRNDLTEKNRYNKILQKNLEEVRTKMVVQEDQDKRKYDYQMTQMIAQKERLLAERTQQLEKLKQEKQQMEVTTQSGYIQTQGRNQKMLQDIEVLYEKKLAIQNKKYFQLETVFEKEKEQQASEKSLVQRRTQQTLELLRKEFIECFKRAEKVHSGQQQAISFGEREFTEKVTQIEDEHECQLKKITAQIVKLEHDKNKNSIEYITNIESLKRECRLLSDDIVKFMSENEMMLKHEEDCRYTLNDILRQIQQKREDLLFKQDALKNRQERLAQYQQRIADLQKKKEVLSYRTWEMRQEIEPKQDQIEFLKQQIFRIEKQFQKLLQDQKVLAQTDAKLKRARENTTAELAQQRQLTREKRLRIKKVTDEIEEAVQSKSTEKTYYQRQMKQIYDKYMRFMSQNRRNHQNPKGLDQIERHLHHIDHQIVEVNKKTDGTLRKRDQEIQKATQDNADLIKELTTFREERAKLTQELKNVQKIVDNLMRQIKQLKNINQGPKDAGMTSQVKKQQLQPISGKVGMTRSSSQPGLKGKVCRGVNYDPGSLSIFTKAKIKDLQAKIQAAKANYRQLQMVARIIKQKIQDHVDKESCNDPAVKKVLQEYDI